MKACAQGLARYLQQQEPDALRRDGVAIGGGAGAERSSILHWLTAFYMKAGARTMRMGNLYDLCAIAFSFEHQT